MCRRLTCSDITGYKRLLLDNARTVEGLNLPSQTILRQQIVDKFPNLKEVPFPCFQDGVPRILIGLDNKHLLKTQEEVPANDQEVNAARTALGWLVYGYYKNQAGYPLVMMIGSTFKQDEADRMSELELQVRNYFEKEDCSLMKPDNVHEPEDVKRAKEIMKKTTRCVNSRYETGLLWASDHIELPDSRKMAVQRFLNLEKKLDQDPEVKNRYQSVIQSYLDQKYARRMSKEEAAKTSPRTFYLPHFAVKNLSKPDKLRVVFDSAAKVHGISLNSQLLPGPDLNQPMMKVLFQFRERSIGVCADIKEMFLQVKVKVEDQDSQRFLWRNEKKEPLSTYVMTSLIFGNTCSPTCAQYVKNLNANQFKDTYPEAAKIIVENHYVDDAVHSAFF